jgi:hypothetical protein
MEMTLRRVGVVALGLLLVASTSGGTALARAGNAAAAGTVGGFSYGQLQDQTVGGTGCGTNPDGEPSVHVSKANLVEVGSERGVGSGSELWRATQPGGSSADACRPTYSGQPNAVGPIGASGGDIDTAFAPVRSSAGTYRLYVASLNLASVNVAVSNDNGRTFSQMPVQGGIPLDDREWIAAYGADTSLLTYHDIASNNIDVLRSDSGAGPYTQIAAAIPATDYKAGNNELGNIVIDHRNPSPKAGGFWAYQSFVAPSTPNGSTYNEAFLAVSDDGGHSWTDKPIPCTTKFGGNGFGHQFPNVSVAPNGRLFYAVSNGKAVYVASSTDHGNTWTCSGAVSSTVEAVMPWIVATSAGEDLVYYGTPTSASGQTWSVYFAQNRAQSVSGWKTTPLMPVHKGSICEGGVSCSGGRQLFDDFGVDTDQAGWAHIAYSHDSPGLGGSGTYTGYAVQRSGTRVGAPN